MVFTNAPMEICGCIIVPGDVLSVLANTSHPDTISSLQIFFFAMSPSYVRPGTRFDLTCSQFGRTKNRRENNMFQCNKIT